MIKGDLFGGGLNNMKQELASLIAIAHETTKCIVLPRVRTEPSSARFIPFNSVIDIDKTLEKIGSDIQVVEASPKPLYEYKFSKEFTMGKAKDIIRQHPYIHLRTRTLWHAQDWARTPIWYKLLDNCVLEESLQEKVDNILRRVGPFIAVHARVEEDWEQFCATRKGYSLKQHFRNPEQIAEFVVKHPLTKQSKLKTILVLSGDSDYDVREPFERRGYRVYMRSDFLRGREHCYTVASALDFELAKSGSIFFGNSESTFSQNICRLNPKNAYYNLDAKHISTKTQKSVSSIRLYKKRRLWSNV